MADKKFSEFTSQSNLDVLVGLFNGVNIQITKADLKTALSIITSTERTKLDGIQALAQVNVIPASDSGKTELALTNVLGVYHDMASANATTIYTTTGTTLGAWAKVLINAASEPVVTGATKIAGATFANSTNMYMVVTHNGNRVEFWFLEI